MKRLLVVALAFSLPAACVNQPKPVLEAAIRATQDCVELTSQMVAADNGDTADGALLFSQSALKVCEAETGRLSSAKSVNEVEAIHRSTKQKLKQLIGEKMQELARMQRRPAS